MTTFQLFMLNAAQIILIVICGLGAVFSFFTFFETKTHFGRVEAVTYCVFLASFTTWLVADLGG